MERRLFKYNAVPRPVLANKKKQQMNVLKKSGSRNEQWQEHLKQFAQVPLTDKSLTPSDKEVVQRIVVEKLLRPHLEKYFYGPIFFGGSYESTGIPGSSDYDLQWCIRKEFLSDAIMETSGVEGWKRIKSGPSAFSVNGYLSVLKARSLMQSIVDKTMPEEVTDDKTKKRYEIKKSTGKAKAYSLELIEKSSERAISMDIIISVRSEDLPNGTRTSDFELVARPFTHFKNKNKVRPDLWAISYSQQEKDLLNRLNRECRNVIALYRFVKFLRKDNDTLRPFPSYFYKLAVFDLYSDKSDDSYWTDEELPERFKDLIQILSTAFKDHRLLELNNPNLNLMSRYTKGQVRGIKDHLIKVNRTGRYDRLYKC